MVRCQARFGLARMSGMIICESSAVKHVPKDERSKLDAKIRQCVFIGYGQDEFGYKFFDPVERV